MGPARAAPAGEHLFVYGSLRRACRHPMHRLLAAHARHLGEASVAGRLYLVGWYPALVAAADESARVQGELYALTDPRRVLAALDRYEGCHPSQPRPHEYRRERATVRLADGTALEAWVYVYQRAVNGLPLIAGGDYLAHQRRRGARVDLGRGPAAR